MVWQKVRAASFAVVISVERSGQAPVLLLLCLWGVSCLLDYEMEAGGLVDVFCIYCLGSEVSKIPGGK